ncbi:metal-dependent hydrolase [Gammaproteobacteria bacterium 45_16_T64]|nr:metal-dependent hydrolase [Gammaproteobacteria bacterium 45_16_T64]
MAKKRSNFSYLSGYSADLVAQIEGLLDEGRLGDYLHQRYPDNHQISTSKALYHYVQEIKNTYLRKSAPLSKIIYDDKIDTVNNALGLHTYISRVQGAKLKAKKEIRISTLFKQSPEPFLRMIVVHELAHLREKEHNKAFYKLCEYMEPRYHQLEFDVRVYLTYKDIQASPGTIPELWNR